MQYPFCFTAYIVNLSKGKNMRFKSVCALLVFLFYGCASQPKDIQTVSVSPLIYQKYTCDQLIMEADRVSRRTQQLHASLKKTADDDATQMTVGMLLLWPTLFWLEGGDGPEASEYARIKGEAEALERTAITKNCSLNLIPNAAEEIAKAEAKKAEENAAEYKKSQVIDEDACEKYGDC
jgi:hypothetical protein